MSKLKKYTITGPVSYRCGSERFLEDSDGFRPGDVITRTSTGPDSDGDHCYVSASGKVADLSKRGLTRLRTEKRYRITAPVAYSMDGGRYPLARPGAIRCDVGDVITRTRAARDRDGDYAYRTATGTVQRLSKRGLTRLT